MLISLDHFLYLILRNCSFLNFLYLLYNLNNFLTKIELIFSLLTNWLIKCVKIIHSQLFVQEEVAMLEHWEELLDLSFLVSILATYMFRYVFNFLELWCNHTTEIIGIVFFILKCLNLLASLINLVLNYWHLFST